MTESQVPIVWSGLLTDRTGFAEEARQFVLALDSIGLDIRADPLYRSPWRARLTGGAAERLERLTLVGQPHRFVQVVHTPVSFLRRHPDADRVIARTVFETKGPLPLAALSAMDEIWVASDFNVESFASVGVDRRKLVKIPQPLDTRLYDPALPPLELAGTESRFVFLSVFVWQWRKGWDVLIRAYVEEFAANENVVLVLKVDQDWSPRDTITDVQRNLHGYLRYELGVERPPPIQVLEYDLTDYEMAALYRAADAYVLPTRGEGWGRPYMEAMASGLPTIGTGVGGNVEFMTPDNAYLIDYVETDVPEHVWEEVPWYAYHRWVEPSVSHLRNLMRRVYEERDEAAAVGSRAREEITSRYSWKPVAELVAEQLQIEVAATASTRSTTPRPQVRWEGPQLDDTPAAIVGRETARALIGTGEVDISLPINRTEQVSVSASAWAAEMTLLSLPSAPPDVYIRSGSDTTARPSGPARRVFLDTTDLGAVSTAALNGLDEDYDEVWVPSTAIRKRYLAAGADPSRIAVVPTGVNHVLFTPAAAPLALATSKTFKLLFVGGAGFDSGSDIALEAYRAAFTPQDDVCLVMMDHPEDRLHDLISLFAMPVDGRNPPEVLYLNEDIPHDELAGLYTACDALIHPTRMDPTGLTVLEAMACGLPVIVPANGVYRDLCPPNTARLIETTQVSSTVNRVDGVDLVEPAAWVEVDRRRLQTAMRHVFDDRDAARAMGQRASEHVLDNRRWSQTGDVALDRIENLLSQPATEPTPDRDDAPQPELTVCMMVRNEEAHLGRAIQSVAEVADQVVVVDVGSTDRTAEIARGLGADVFTFDDPDDFGAARNKSLNHATGKWILVLDGDEHLDPASHPELREVAATGDFTGYMVRILNYTDRRGTESYLEHATLRLFPNHSSLRYAGTDPHSQLVSLDPELPLDLRTCGIVLHHEGYRPQVMEDGAKLERNLRGLERAAAEEPDSPFHAFNLGLTYSLMGRPQDAERELLRSVALAGAQTDNRGWSRLLPNAYLSLSVAVFTQERFVEAVSYCKSALRLVPDFSDAYLTMGAALLRLERYDEAIAAYERAIDATPETGSVATDRSTSTWKPLLGIAEVHAAAGRWETSMSYLTQAHQMSPESPDVALGVARTSLASGDIEAAEGILDVVVQREDAPPDAWMIRAELELQRERPDEAARVLEEAILRRPMHKPMFQAQIAEISRTDVV